MTFKNPRPPTGRMAPSPTGGLHLGHARTFLAAWVAAKTAAGKIVLRVEDLDAGRVRADAIEGIYNDLQWLGLTWDEGPYVQSLRIETYRLALDVLRRRNLVYRCTCTRSDIARAVSAPHEEDEGPAYPGTCAWRQADDAVKIDQPFAWRFRVPAKLVTWTDEVKGIVSINPTRTGGDFVVARSDGAISYQLAVVVDDAAMGITQVVRGDDLVSSTPRQLLLYDALKLDPPSFAHIPLVVGTDGRRLAKREHSIKLASLRDQGVHPRRLIGILARSCGWPVPVIGGLPIDLLGLSASLTLPDEPWKLTQEILGEILKC